PRLRRERYAVLAVERHPGRRRGCRRVHRQGLAAMMLFGRDLLRALILAPDSMDVANPGPTWHGTLEGLRNTDRPRVTDGLRRGLGSDPGAGLVSAWSVEALLAGRYLDGRRTTPWRPVSAVYYRRNRGTNGRYWFHDLEHTIAARTRDGLVFEHD